MDAAVSRVPRVFSVLLIVLVFHASPALAQLSRPTDEITKPTDDVYLFRHQSHQNIFFVTPEGVIVTDPISPEAATCLKSENLGNWKYLTFADDQITLPTIKAPRVTTSVPSSVPANEKFTLFALPTHFNASFSDGRVNLLTISNLLSSSPGTMGNSV